MIQVELLVMKALSLGLVKGSIDQVDKKVHMTWVQPRVLDRNQVKTLILNSLILPKNLQITYIGFVLNGVEPFTVLSFENQVPRVDRFEQVPGDKFEHVSGGSRRGQGRGT